MRSRTYFENGVESDSLEIQPTGAGINFITCVGHEYSNVIITNKEDIIDLLNYLTILKNEMV